MANNQSVEVLDGDQLAVATLPINGTIIGGGGKTDKTALVQTSDGEQLAVKTILLGSGGSAKPEYVTELPETGEEGVLYLVPSGETRQGYAIFQMFSWHEGEWVAIGAYDVGISPDGILYEENFNSSTNTLDVTTLGEDAKNSLSTIAGYNQNVPVQRLANLGGVMKWQTQEVWYDNFNTNNNLKFDYTFPDSITSLDIILGFDTYLDSNAQNILIMYVPNVWNGLFYASNTGSYYQGHYGQLGYYRNEDDTMTWFSDILPAQGKVGKWIRVVGDNTSQQVYLIDDNNYTVETLPDLSNWTLQGTITETFTGNKVGFSSQSANFANGALKNCIISVNGTKVYDLREGNNVITENNSTAGYKAVLNVAKTEHWK